MYYLINIFDVNYYYILLLNILFFNHIMSRLKNTAKSWLEPFQQAKLELKIIESIIQNFHRNSNRNSLFLEDLTKLFVKYVSETILYSKYPNNYKQSTITFRSPYNNTLKLFHQMKVSKDKKLNFYITMQKGRINLDIHDKFN